jgi:hypothetical protein
MFPLLESTEIVSQQTSARKIRLSEIRLEQPCRVSNFPAWAVGEPVDSGGCPFLGTSFGQAKEVQNKKILRSDFIR